MKYLIILLLGSLSAFAQITYPVSASDTFTFKLDGQTKRGVKWPRQDRMQLVGAPTNLVILREVFAPIPSYNPATHKLASGVWTDDTNAQTATLARAAIPLTAEELAELAAEADIETKRTNLNNAIATLRTWSDQAAATTVTTNNQVAVLQTIVTRLGVFFDNFADLLETR